VTPTPEEVAALLSLPANTRAELARVEGPGWLLDPDGGSFAPDVPVPFFSPPNMRDGMGWLPASECAILALCPIDRAPFLTPARDGWTSGFNDGVHFVAPTPRLAALYLLARVTG
jgi:hypothetical protein